MEKEGVERKEVGPHNREMEKRHGGISEAKITQSVGCKNMMHRGSGVLFSVCVCIHGLKEHMNKHKEKVSYAKTLNEVGGGLQFNIPNENSLWLGDW